MRRQSWRSLRSTLLAVAIAAFAMNGLRELPALRDCYSLWRGVDRARRDVELVGAGSGLDSNAGRRAVINARQAREQAEAYWQDHFPGPFGLACLALAGMSGCHWLTGRFRRSRRGEWSHVGRVST